MRWTTTSAVIVLSITIITHGSGWSVASTTAPPDTSASASASASASTIPPIPSPPVALPAFGAAIDDYAASAPMTSCHPIATEGARTVMRLMYARAARPVNITRDCSIGGLSEHKEGRAIDWGTNARVKAQRKAANRYMTWLLATDEHGNTHAMARRLGVHYIIWNGRWWRSHMAHLGWTEFGTCRTQRTARTFDSYCHRDHVHITLSWDGAQMRTSYYGGVPVTTPSCTMARGTIAPALPAVTEPLLPMEPLRMLDTAAGVSVAIPCRLTQRAFTTERRELRVVVPVQGASAVLLQVTVVDPNAPTVLHVFPAGTAQPSESIMRTDLTGGTATVLVAPGVGNAIAFATGSGAHHLIVDLIGYVPAPPLITPAG
jgi:hypothetical protein